MQNINNYDFTGKKAIVRVDFNVPLNEKFEVTDSTRIEAAAATIKKIAETGAVILMSHLGRPKNKEEKYSLKHIVYKINEILDTKIKFVNDCIGPDVETSVAKLQKGEILLLENLRYYAEEEKGDKIFAEKLSKLADVYVNDAFGTAHRSHASTAVIADFFPKEKMFGYLMEEEVKSLEKVLLYAEKPFTAILGGAKVSTKIPVIEQMLSKVDNLIIGGGMMFTFIKASGGNVGNSLVEDEFLETAKQLLKKARANKVNLYLPVDSINADKFANDAKISKTSSDNVPEGEMGLDIGEKTVEIFSNVIENSKTILWNGPMGVFEMDNFAQGTIKIANSLVKATKKGAFTLVGGGDSVAAVNKYNLQDKVSYVSTGGGAMLEFIEGIELPGVSAVRK